MIALVSDQRTEIRSDDRAAADLRAHTAAALRSVADLLRDSHSPNDAREAVGELRTRVARAQVQSGEHHFAAAAITLNLEHAVAAWA